MRAGGVVAYPTETFYGLGVDAFNDKALEKIYAIKKRPFSQPLLILIHHLDVLCHYVQDIPEVAWSFIEKFWPGPLTLIFPAASHLPQLLCAHTRKVAIRISSHPIAHMLVESLDSPITSTSANISGAASPLTAQHVLTSLGKNIDLVIDGGPTQGGKASTIIDVTPSPPRLIREGAIPFEEIKKLLPFNF